MKSLNLQQEFLTFQVQTYPINVLFWYEREAATAFSLTLMCEKILGISLFNPEC